MPTDQTGVSWTSEELLADVRQKSRIPPGTVDYTDAVLLEEATRALWSFAGWAVSQAADGRLIQTLLRQGTFNSTYAQGREVNLPFDAVADTIDSVVWYNAGSRTEHRLEMIQLWDQSMYDAPDAQGINPWGYSLSNDGKLRLYPRPLSSGQVRLAYQRRLPKLVLSSDAEDVMRLVVSVSMTTNSSTITYSGADGFVAFGDLAHRRYDIINPVPPYRYIMPNFTASPIAANQCTTFDYNTTNWGGYAVAATDDVLMVVSGLSPFVHLPLEFKQAVTCYVSSQLLSEIGDQQGAGVMEARAEKELGRVIALMTPRSQTTRIKVVNPFSLLRTRRWARWGVP